MKRARSVTFQSARRELKKKLRHNGPQSIVDLEGYRRRIFLSALHSSGLRNAPRAAKCGSLNSSKFKVSTTIAAAIVTVHPGGIRELHWHPNADEWQNGDEDDGNRGRSLQPTCASSFVGRVRKNLAPHGELEAAHKRPPWDSTIERLIRSPIPVP
jgi:hypothetical protein